MTARTKIRVLIIGNVILGTVLTIALFLSNGINFTGGSKIKVEDARALIAKYRRYHKEPSSFLLSLDSLKPIISNPNVTHLHIFIGSSRGIAGNHTLIFAGAYNKNAADQSPAYVNVGVNGRNDYMIEHIFPIYGTECWELDYKGDRVQDAEGNYVVFPVEDL